MVKFAFCKMYFLRTECNHLNREKWKQMIVVNSAPADMVFEEFFMGRKCLLSGTSENTRRQ